MLDRLFLSKLNSTGKAAYWIGQITLILVWALVVFGFMGMSLDDGGEGMLILGIVAIVAVWGGICIMIWPIEKELDDQFDDIIDDELAQMEKSEEKKESDVGQVKIIEEQVRQ